MGSLDALTADNLSPPRFGSTAAGVSLAKGFLIPNPPLIISSGVSGLKPSCNEKRTKMIIKQS